MMFYHSFPRLSRHSGTAPLVEPCQIGIETLKCIIRYGLLLTPEELNIPSNPNSDSSHPPSSTITQRRACFTLIDQIEVTNLHAKFFGNFSIGLDSLEARQLGIIPTFYYYSQKRSARTSDGGFSAEILFRLSEIRRVLICLSLIQSRANGGADDEYLKTNSLNISDEPAAAASLSRLTESDAKMVMKLFDTDRVPALDLTEWSELILSAFQTADSAKSEEHLKYYSQREWRIIQLFSQDIACVPLKPFQLKVLKPKEIAFVLNAKKAIQSLVHSSSRKYPLDECYLLLGTRDVHFRNFIREVIVPSEAANDVEAFLNTEFRTLQFRAKSGNEYAIFSRTHR